MIETRTALIDSNVVIDIIGEDASWQNWSMGALMACEAPIVSPIIFAELCYLKSSHSAVEKVLDDLGIGYEELPKSALFLAAHAYKTYRSRGGSRTSPLPDFFIGGHAASEGIPIVTRDAAYYQTYFPTVELICPK